MHNTLESDSKPIKLSSRWRKIRRCYDDLIIISFLFAKQKTMQADEFMEGIVPEIESQLSEACCLIEAVAKSLERGRKNQPSCELEEELGNVAELVKTYQWLESQLYELKCDRSTKTDLE